MTSRDVTGTPPSEIETARINDARSSGCCGGPAPQGVTACCADDAQAKSAGGSGCGCGSRAPSPRETTRVRSGCCG